MPDETQKPEKKKRVTVAELQKEIEELQTNVLSEMAPWCGELDARLEALEERTAKHNDTLLSDVKTRLDMLDKSMSILSDNQAVLLKQHLEHEERIDEVLTAGEAMTSAFEKLHEIPAVPEIEFDVRPEPPAGGQSQAYDVGSLRKSYPPAQPAGGQVTADDIATVACVCLTMNDVLMICRALKEAEHIPDQEKIWILNVACRAAGVSDTPGLRIRAGISATEAAGGR